MVYRNNTGRLGAGFISVCLETRWLGQNRGFYKPEPPCSTCVCVRARDSFCLGIVRRDATNELNNRTRRRKNIYSNMLLWLLPRVDERQKAI